MRKVKFFPLFILLTLALAFNASAVSADITNVSVTPQIDTGDTDKFEMVVKPGEKRSLTIAFTNFGSAVERLKIEPTNAQTDATGVFVYNQVVKKGFAGLQAAFAEMTSKKTITLQPQESKTETIVVTTPSERFDGVIYGGLNIYSVNANGGQLNGESSSIPVIITQTNENVPGTGKITGIEAKAIGYQPNIVIKLQNSKPGEAKNVSYNLMIQRKGMFSFLGFNGRKVPVYQSDLSIAPNSVLPIPVNYKQQPLSAGDYMVTGSYTINGKSHKVNETYKISKADAEKVNKQSKGLIYDKTWIFVLVIIGLIILIAIVIFLIVRQIRYNRREENNRLVAESDKILKSEKEPDEKPKSKGSYASYGQSNVSSYNNTPQNSDNGLNNSYINPNTFQPNGQNSNNQQYNNYYPNNQNGPSPYYNNPNYQQAGLNPGNIPGQQPFNQSNPNWQQPNQIQNPNFGQQMPNGSQGVNPNYPTGFNQPNGQNLNPNNQPPRQFDTPQGTMPQQYNQQMPNGYNPAPNNGYPVGQMPSNNFNQRQVDVSDLSNSNSGNRNQNNDDWDDLSLDDLLKKH